MLRQTYKCKFCNRDMNVSRLEWLENSMCSNCLEERIEKAASQITPPKWTLVGRYFIPSPNLEKSS